MIGHLGRRAVLTLVVTGVLLTAGGGSIWALADTTPTHLDPPTVVRNSSSTESLAIQLQLGVRNTGAFDFQVAGVGNWMGVVPLGPVSSKVSHIKGTAKAVFQATETDTTSPAIVRMEGVIDPSHHFASVNVWVSSPVSTAKCDEGEGGTDKDKSAKLDADAGKHSHPGSERADHDKESKEGACHMTHYHLVTSHLSTEKAAKVAKEALSALVQGKLATLYAMSSSAIKNRYSESQFVKTLSAEKMPKIISGSFTGPGSIKVTGGYGYYTQPITFIAKGTPGNTTYTASIVLVEENGSWRLFGTSTPKPVS